MSAQWLAETHVGPYSQRPENGVTFCRNRLGEDIETQEAGREWDRVQTRTLGA